MNIGVILTTLGQLALVEEDNAIRQLLWTTAQTDLQNQGSRSAILKEGLAQLEAYFDGRLQRFDLPLAPDVSSFQASVLDQISAIPLGETKTYGDIAKVLDAPAQPVGNACGANPIPIIIPCHRVVGANSLGGFSGAGGIESKVWLLKFEGAGLLI